MPWCIICFSFQAVTDKGCCWRSDTAEFSWGLISLPLCAQPSLIFTWGHFIRLWLTFLTVQATIIRSGALVGTEDRLLNRWAAQAKKLPFVPLPGGGKSKYGILSWDHLVYLCGIKHQSLQAILCRGRHLSLAYFDFSVFIGMHAMMKQFWVRMGITGCSQCW